MQWVNMLLTVAARGESLSGLPKEFYHGSLQDMRPSLNRAVSLESTYLRLSIQCDDMLFMVQQFAGICNVNGCFLFVTCEDPNLQAGLS